MISKEEAIRKNKELELKKLKKEFKVYDNNLLNKNFLLIYSDMSNKLLSKLKNPARNNLNNLRGIEILFKKENFAHLVGIPKDGKKLGAKEFYNKLKEDKISREDYETSPFAKLKEQIFDQIPKIFKQIIILGDYNYSKQSFKVDKILGGTKQIPSIVLGLKLDSNQYKFDIIKKYNPASILKEITGNCILKKSARKILYILKKDASSNLYQEIIFIHRDFTEENIYNDNFFFNCCENQLKDIITVKLKK